MTQPPTPGPLDPAPVNPDSSRDDAALDQTATAAERDLADSVHSVATTEAPAADGPADTSEPASEDAPPAGPEATSEAAPEAVPEAAPEPASEPVQEPVQEPASQPQPAPRLDPTTEAAPTLDDEPVTAPELEPAVAQQPAPEVDAPAQVAPAEAPPADPSGSESADPATESAAETAAAPSEGESSPAEQPTASEPPAEPSQGEQPAASEPVGDATSSESAPATPKPSALPRPSIPTPAALAKVAPHPPATAAPPLITTDHSASAAFGRVDEQGTVFVRTAEGEKEVGSYPGASDEQALTYFARKYDELFASAVLLEQRLEQPEVPSKDVQEGLKALAAQVADATVVGDLDALATKLDEIQSGIAAKRVVEQQHRAHARAAAKVERERIVAEAETIAAQPENRIQWKTSGARMRELLDEWKAHQRSSTRLDRESETALWQRFSSARNGFDKARRTHFAGLDAAHADAKSAKERLVADAERLATSTDWAATAGAFKRLMDDWRHAGRASRSDDDKLWARFKAAQDAFFAAKDAVVAAEEEQYVGNLQVKEALLVEAEAILPVTDLEKAKGQLRALQDKWDAAGKVPRADMERVEKAMRRIEQTVRDADEKRWKSSNPEVAARARAMVDQLERAVADLQSDLDKAEASGNASKVKKAREALEARQAWLDQARAGVAEFGG